MFSLHIYLLISNAAYSCQTSKSRFLSENMKLIGQNRPVFLLRRQVNEAERQAKRADNFVISLRNHVLLVIRFFGPDTSIFCHFSIRHVCLGRYVYQVHESSHNVIRSLRADICKFPSVSQVVCTRLRHKGGGVEPGPEKC